MKTLQKVYFDPSHEASFSGSEKLLRVSRKKKISRNKTIQWLESQDVYTKHRPLRHRFPRRFYNVRNIDDVWEADLVDLRSIKTYNDDYVYLLVVIDVLSKYAWVEPLTDKTAVSVAKAFTRILASKNTNGRSPIYLQSDKGKEFIGTAFQALLKKKNIQFRVARNPDIKAAIVERFNRTLKERMWRFFTYSGSKRYIDVLQNIVSAYNQARHSSIKMAPASVTFATAAKARTNLLQRYAQPKSHHAPKYAVGDIVRISSAKAVFAKGYESGWSSELFKVHRVSRSSEPVVYILRDLHDEDIDGIFYEPELSKVQVTAAQSKKSNNKKKRGKSR